MTALHSCTNLYISVFFSYSMNTHNLLPVFKFIYPCKQWIWILNKTRKKTKNTETWFHLLTLQPVAQFNIFLLLISADTVSCSVVVIDKSWHPVRKTTLWRSRRKAWGLTCSSSCLSLCSCDSSCLLWSSRICILASRRPLCWRSSLASAMSSASRGLCGETGIISGGDGSGDSPLWSCCCFKRSYSACKFLLRSIKVVKTLWSQTGWCRLSSAWGSEKAPSLMWCEVSTYWGAEAHLHHLPFILMNTHACRVTPHGFARSWYYRHLWYNHCLKALRITRIHSQFPLSSQAAEGWLGSSHPPEDRVRSVLGLALPQHSAFYPS